MKEYRRAVKRIEVSVGDSVRVLRELQELSQNDLAQLTGIPQSTISAIERDRINIGVERAKILARVHSNATLLCLFSLAGIFSANRRYRAWKVRALKRPAKIMDAGRPGPGTRKFPSPEILSQSRGERTLFDISYIV